MDNQALKAIYERAYEGGKDQFFTFPTADVSEEVLKELDWRGLRVLEIGCGTGETAYLLASAGAEVLAVDYAAPAIEQAKARHAHPSLEYRVAGAEDVDGEFDAIVLQEVIEHLDDPPASLRRLLHLLRPGGSLVLTCPSFANLRGHVWMTLQILLDVPMSLTDRHFLSPFDVEAWASELGLTCRWRTFRHSQAHGDQMQVDMRKRLTNALRDAGLDNTRVDALLAWLRRVAAYESDASHNGAKAIFRLTRA